MTEVEFQAFLAADIAVYAAEEVRAGNWTPEESLTRSREEHDHLLPSGLSSPHQYLFTIELEGVPVGRIWFSTDPRASGGAGFIYDLFVDETARRKGVATEAMILLEKEARELGLTRLALHVFPYNVAARSLYEKLGYQVTDISMQKSLPPRPPS